MGGDRARDRDALALTTGKFVRELGRVSGMEADELEQLIDARRNRAPAKAARSSVARAKHPDRLGDDVADPPARIERREWVLEDHLDAPANRAPHGSIAGLSEVHAVDQHLALARFEPPNHHARQRRFPGAGFAHKAKRFAAVDRKVEAVDSRERPARLAIDQP